MSDVEQTPDLDALGLEKPAEAKGKKKKPQEIKCFTCGSVSIIENFDGLLWFNKAHLFAREDDDDVATSHSAFTTRPMCGGSFFFSKACSIASCKWTLSWVGCSCADHSGRSCICDDFASPHS